LVTLKIAFYRCNLLNFVSKLIFLNKYILTNEIVQIKVIESDEEDISQTAEENAMDTSAVEPELQEEMPQIQPIQVPPLLHAQQVQPVQQIHHPIIEPQFDLEADISQLEAPTFTTINRGPPEPMLRLRWDHRVNLIGEKVLNPMIHCCDKCLKPILIYGRMVRSS
jgi:hypothetical protein